jgi:DNA-binding LacI/PurR family transcriptional regulator
MLLPDTPYLGTGGNRVIGLAGAFPEIAPTDLEKHHVRFMAGMEGAKAERAFEISKMATENILSEERDTEAIFYYTDQGAMGGIRALMGRGLVPGRDIAVAAVNDSSGARYGAFPFTSVGHDTKAIADALLAERTGRGDLRRFLPPEVWFRGP